jgi:hypothetical protein
LRFQHCLLAPPPHQQDCTLSALAWQAATARLAS